MKVLAIDYGAKKIGLAISDELGMIAAGLPMLKVSSQIQGLKQLTQVVEDHKPDKILLGLPSGWKGDSPQTKETRDFAEVLKKTVDLEIEFWDESYSTYQAEQGAKGRKKKHSDSEAARIILQEYLDYLQREQN